MKLSLLFILAVFPSMSFLYAQPDYRVLDWKTDQTVNTYLLHHMRRQYDERRIRLTRALGSAASASVYRDSCRQRYRELIGLLPKRAPMHARQTGLIRQEGYTIEKIIYESVPGHHVTANLYVPHGKGPFPAVLLMCGHEDDAKATESYQRTAILFALHKFVVLVVDPVSQAERHQLTDKNGKPLTRGGTTEHTLLNAAASLVGSGTVAIQLWDNIRALDFLESRNEVDVNRIGCLGNSGGGTQTTYLIGFDERVKVAAPCSYVASRERNFELAGANDGCQHVPGEGEALLEISDFLIMFSPKPLLVLAGRYDFVDYTGTTIAFDEVSQVYDRLNASERLKLVTIDDGHGISKPKREAAVSWFKRWLNNDTSPVSEPELVILTREQLRCGTKEQVTEMFADERSAFDRSLRLADTHADDRKKTDPSTLPEKTSSLIRLEPDHAGTHETIGAVSAHGITFDKVILRSSRGVPLPLLAAYPAGKIREVVIWFDERGKATIADSAALIKRYLSEGKAVIAADVSGIGELADSRSANDPKYYNREYRNAMLAIHTGTSLPAMRTADIIRVLEFATREKASKVPVSVYASGVCVVPALHAAVLDRRIDRLSVIGGIRSFYEIFKSPDARDWYSVVIPGVLTAYDLPDLERALGTRFIRVK